MIEEAIHSYNNAVFYIRSALLDKRTKDTFIEGLKRLAKAYEEIFRALLLLKDVEPPKNPYIMMEKTIELYPELKEHYEFYKKIKEWLSKDIKAENEGTSKFTIYINGTTLYLKDMRKLSKDLEILFERFKRYLNAIE
ncbi:NEQ224 [Nanoarchaeum equitans Kin4-M]|uniref:NEQ224 n=1 Tax=Nanoarchaeum equitans (strain Kin4-M) TaxID=228908 RepID=Q74NE9_NANEQ|nr:NEQ224 [Nanoarchaeum equitans Kin4-M]